MNYFFNLRLIGLGSSFYEEHVKEHISVECTLCTSLNIYNTYVVLRSIGPEGNKSVGIVGENK